MVKKFVRRSPKTKHLRWFLVQAFARIENHYFVNKGFFPAETYLLDNIEKIRHINTVIVQVCLLSLCGRQKHIVLYVIKCEYYFSCMSRLVAYVA